MSLWIRQGVLQTALGSCSRGLWKPYARTTKTPNKEEPTCATTWNCVHRARTLRIGRGAAWFWSACLQVFLLGFLYLLKQRRGPKWQAWTRSQVWSGAARCPVEGGVGFKGNQMGTKRRTVIWVSQPPYDTGPSSARRLTFAFWILQCGIAIRCITFVPGFCSQGANIKALAPCLATGPRLREARAAERLMVSGSSGIFQGDISP